jgi:SAM-dependent methyltransferase
VTRATRWGARAADLYCEAYASRYRAADDSIADGALVRRFSSWLAAVCDGFGRDIDVLDVGCGTGRYFQALRRVRRLVGVDVSRPMLARAAQPLGTPMVTPELVEADFLAHDFNAGEFDLVYSIGVLAEHSPFDPLVAARVHRWLRTAGKFAFTAVHPLSFSVPRTLKRRVAEALLPFSGGAARRALRRRLMRDGLYADEERVREVLGGAGFVVESVEPYRSDVHMHLMTVARKP